MALNEEILKNPEILNFMRKHNISDDDPLFMFLAAEKDLLLQFEELLTKTKSDIISINETLSQNTKTETEKIFDNQRVLEKCYAEFDAIIKRYEDMSGKTYALLPTIRDSIDTLKTDIEEKIRGIDTDILIQSVERTINEKASMIPAESLQKTADQLKEAEHELKASASVISGLTTNIKIKALLVAVTIGAIIGILAGFTLGLSSYVRKADRVTENMNAIKTITEKGATITAGKDDKGHYIMIDAEGGYDAKKVDGKAVIYIK